MCRFLFCCSFYDYAVYYESFFVSLAIYSASFLFFTKNVELCKMPVNFLHITLVIIFYSVSRHMMDLMDL